MPTLQCCIYCYWGLDVIIVLGEHMGALAMSEAGSGSDVVSMKV